MPHIQFELVSPEKRLVSKPVAMVTIPGGEGDYGVLAGHAPLITTVKPGVIGIYAENENSLSEKIFVAGGFAETNAERCTVLAEEAIPVAQLDRAAIEQQMKAAADDAAAAKTEAEKEAAESKRLVAEAKLQAIAA